MKLDQIVDNVIAKKGFRVESLFEEGSRGVEPMEIERENVDSSRPLKGIATDIVVDQFFQSESTLYHFLKLVYTVFDDALNIYKERRGIADASLFFVYKGGSVMRIVSNEFLLEIPNHITREIKAAYKPFFKRSDADFSIYLDPTVSDYDEVYSDLTTLSYLLQNEIRDIFMADLTRYFDYFKYTTEWKSKILTEYLEKFNALEHDSDSPYANKEYINLSVEKSMARPERFEDRYQPVKDSAIVFADDKVGANVREGAQAFIDYGSSGKTFMTITDNSALDFTGGAEGEIRTRFNLTRTKIMFNLFEYGSIFSNRRTIVGGELIDVSIGHRDDNGMQHFFENGAIDALEKNIATYTLFGGEDDKTPFQFRSYKLNYLEDDLLRILFEMSTWPWEDAKYVKRVNRLMYLYFIDIWITESNSKTRENAIKYIQKKIFRPLLKAKSSSDIESVIATMGKFKKDKSKLHVAKLMTYLEDLLTDLMAAGVFDRKGALEVADLKSNFIELITTMDSNFKIVSKAFKRVNEYCVADGNVVSRNLYDADIESLL